MSRIRRFALTSFSTVAVTLAILVPGGTIAAARSEGYQSLPAGQTLEGTWRVEITLRNCATGAPAGPSFPALASFARGGTTTTADGGLSPAMRGTGLGVWWREPGGTFTAVTEAFLFAGTTRTGRQRITQQIDVAIDGLEFHADVASEVEDVNGNVTARFCATSVGRRF